MNQSLSPPDGSLSDIVDNFREVLKDRFGVEDFTLRMDVGPKLTRIRVSCQIPTVNGPRGQLNVERLMDRNISRQMIHHDPYALEFQQLLWDLEKEFKR